MNRFQTNLVHCLMQICLFITLIFPQTVLAEATCIGVITVGEAQFWNEVKAGGIQAGRELGIEIYARGPADETDVNGQKRIIQSALNSNCTGFVIAPNSPDINDVVTQLSKQGIPSVYIDRDYGGDRISIISTNNYQAGILAGEEMLRALGGKGNIALFRLSEEVVSTSAREEGFVHAVENGGLEIVIDQFLGSRVGEARENSIKTIKNMKNIDGIFTPNETTTVGVLVNLKNLNKAGDIVHIGFDSHVVMVDALKSDQLYGFVVQRPFEMGYQGVQAVYKAMHGMAVEREVDTKVVFVDKNNIDDLEMNKN